MAHRGEGRRSPSEGRPSSSSSRRRSRSSSRDHHGRRRRRSGEARGARARPDEGRPKREAAAQQQQLQAMQHLASFYEQLPPGLVKEEASKPEDCIPDVPGNERARQFLARAPTKGLWMPLGKEVKVMQCWRCKRYGHRTGDKECPFFTRGNQKLEQFRVAHEDPMHDLIRQNQRHEKERRIQQLKRLLEDSTSSSSSSSSSSSEEEEEEEGSRSSSNSSSSSSGDPGKRKKKKRKKEEKKKRRRKKKRKHKAAKSERKKGGSD